MFQNLFSTKCKHWAGALSAQSREATSTHSRTSSRTSTWCAFTLCTHALPYDHPRRHSNKDDLLSLALCTSVDSCSPVVGLPGACAGWSIASWPFGYDQSVVSVLICLTSDRPQWGQRCYQIFEDTVVLLGLLSTYHGLARYCTYLRDRPTPTPFVGRGIISLSLSLWLNRDHARLGLFCVQSHSQAII